MGEPERRTDRALVEQFRAGDREAFTTLYRAHFPSVYRFAVYMTGDHIRAGEITQDVFVWLVHHPGEFDAERGDLPAFLGGVARKFLLRQQRSERRWLPLNDAAPPPEEQHARDDFASGLEREQDTARLRKAIAALPERAGRIGNNRDIHVVNERWYSNDLQRLVKTVNSAPRFGVTTYQLANIVQGTQDPALFQIPSDYAVVEPRQ
jgi:RNA polymerase sigma factor (sigma-70 family)